MARNRRGKMALYEVMSKIKDKPGYKRTLEKLRTGKPSDEEPLKDKEETAVAETAVEDNSAEVSDDQTVALEEQKRIDDGVLAVQWRRKPRIVQYNNGRVEFSVPYQIGIAAVLGLVVVMLLTFRAGQRSVIGDKANGGSPSANVEPELGKSVPTKNEITANTPGRTVPNSGNAPVPASTGSNVIVLAEYRKSKDLVPVQDHFASNGIATEIVLSGGMHFLVSRDGYSGRSFSSGGDGQLAIRKIAEIGKKYKGKAPEGYETFAPHYFSDAYGKKVE